MEKIVLLSNDNDISTNKIFFQIIAAKKDASVERFEKISIGQCLLYVNNKVPFFLRRGNLYRSNFDGVPNKTVKELKSLKEYLYYKMETTEGSIGSLQKEFNHNKLIDLDKAKNVGFKTPLTVIVSSSSELRKLLFERKKNWITKSIKDPVTIKKDNKMYLGGFTSKLNKTVVNRMDSTFFYSKVQENIEKLFEIRVFYLNNSFYSMAIFSQMNEKTKTDYRHYDKIKPNRNVPFLLPNEIKYKISLLMKDLGLNTGSLDFIMNKDGEYIFLECNPIGQFDWLSVECNYNIENIISKELLRS